MSVCFIPPYIPLLYCKTVVYRGIHYSLIFALKHILWVLVRTASMRRFQRVHIIYVLSKNMKIVQKIQLKIVIFTAVKNRCILHGRVFVMWGSMGSKLRGRLNMMICNDMETKAKYNYFAMLCIHYDSTAMQYTAFFHGCLNIFSNLFSKHRSWANDLSFRAKIRKMYIPVNPSLTI